MLRPPVAAASVNFCRSGRGSGEGGALAAAHAGGCSVVGLLLDVRRLFGRSLALSVPAARVAVASIVQSEGAYVMPGELA